MSILLLGFIVLLIVGALITFVHPEPGNARREMVSRLAALLWALTIGGLISGLAIAVGMLWLFVGATTTILLNSERLSPGGNVADAIRRLARWNIDQVLYGITGKGDAEYQPPI